MALVQKGDFDDNPKIPEDYYVSMFEDVRDYERDNAESRGLILDFKVVHDGSEVVLPFFAPAKLSVSSERESSRLAENLSSIGLLEAVLEMLDCRDEVMSEKHKWIAEDEGEAEELMAALRGVLAGKKIRVNVEDSQDGDESQVSKFSKVFDGSDDDESEDDREAVFEDEESEESESPIVEEE